MSASTLVTAVGQRGAGERYGAPPPGQAPQLSVRARRLGLYTRGDVEEEYRAQTATSAEGGQRNDLGWSVGTAYHCPFCDKDFWSPSGARKHMRTQGHAVLRWDFYPESVR